MKRHLGDKPSHNSCSKVDSLIMQSNEVGDGGADTASSGKSKNHNDALHSDDPNYSTKKLKQIKAQIVSALSQAQSSSAIKALKLQLRLDHPEFTAQEIDDLWKAIAQETNDAEEQAYLINDQLPTLMQVKQQRLVLADYLWGDKGRLAAQLTAIAEAMPTAPEFLLTTLISVAGSRIGAGTRIDIKPSAGYSQPAIYRTMLVAETGCKKTPAQHYILAPLEAMEAEAFAKWQEEQLAYEQLLCNYHADSKRHQAPGKLPSPPRRKRYIVGDSTVEARGRIHYENPRGFLIYRDEGSAHFTSRNKNRCVGDSTEIELSEFNGDVLTKDRKFESIFLAESCISRTGSIQWDVLAGLMKTHDDITGEWSRWLFCAAPIPSAKIDLFNSDSKHDINAYSTLKRLYQNLEGLNSQHYGLSSSSKMIFQSTQHQFVDWMQEENQGGMKVAYPKFESYLARLALWLHVVNASLEGKYPLALIDDSTMLKAAQLTNYFVGQLRLIYGRNAPQNQLTGTLLKIHMFAESKGRPIDARDCKIGIWSLRKSSTYEIRSNLEMLVQSGYGYWAEGKYQAYSKA